MKYLVRIIAHHPYIVALPALSISIFCIYASIFSIQIPSFADPQLGFETRGTLLATRFTAWTNLEKEFKPSGKLRTFPKVPHKKENPNLISPKKQRSVKQKFSDFFCGNPEPAYSKFVIKSLNKSSHIFSEENIRVLCQVQDLIMDYNSAKSLCETGVNSTNCCRPWSIANYVALFNKKTSCLDLTDLDIHNTLVMLKRCAVHLKDNDLKAQCFENNNCDMLPKECTRHNIAFNILYYLMDKSFLRGGEDKYFMDFTAVYLPIARSSGILDFFYDLENRGYDYFDTLEIVAIDFGLKETLFERYILNDLKFVIGGIVFVLISIWIYTKSLLITLIVIYSIIASLAIAYYIYSKVFLLTFFPFMNVLAIVISIGIGADDAFVFCKFWNSPAYADLSIENRLGGTFKHAITSVFLTSLTTAVAFYSSSFSSITAIRLYSIFSGTIVVINFLIMMTLFPACVVIFEKWKLLNCSNSLLSKLNFFDCMGKLEKFCTFFEYLVVVYVLKYRWFWFGLFTFMGFYSTLGVWFYSNLSLPNQRDFQLFTRSHIFEQYDFVYKDHFLSEVELLQMYKIPMRFIWGVNPIDNGSYMDPHSRGHLSFDDTFDLSSPKSQKWLLNFCHDLKNQDFYIDETGPQFLNCFIESFVKWMTRRCIDPVTDKSVMPCCQSSTFPFKRHVFKACLNIYMEELSSTPPRYFSSVYAGPKFHEKNIMKALVVEFSSKYSYTYSYYEMHNFVTSVEQWMQKQLLTAPEPMKNGWFVTDYDFYDLQHALAHDTYVAMMISMGISFSILLVFTGDILICVFAAITVFLIIQIIIFALVLLDWKLNILESVALSSSIGLTVDFSLHYSIGFLFSERSNGDRSEAAKNTLLKMVAPTTMACLTTAFAGLLMLPSHVEPYIQIGTFLFIAMFFSWIYSTFYFGAMLALFGPKHRYGYCMYKLFFKKSEVVRVSENDVVDLPLTPTFNTVSASQITQMSQVIQSPVDPEVCLTNRFPRQRANSV